MSLNIYANKKLGTTKELATIDEITWKFLGTIATVGVSNSLIIPEKAKELFIEVFPLSNNDGISLVVLLELLSSSFKGYDGGFYKNSSDMMRILVYATKSNIWVQEVVLNSITRTSLFSCTVYYK